MGRTFIFAAVVVGGALLALSAFFVGGRFTYMANRMVLDRFTGEVKVCDEEAGCRSLALRSEPPDSASTPTPDEDALKWLVAPSPTK